jgi:hypothetical protein
MNLGETNMEINHGDYVKLANAQGGEVGVAWEIEAAKTASIQVYWWNDGRRWSNYYEPKDLSLVPPMEIPDYAIKLRDSLGL